MVMVMKPVKANIATAHLEKILLKFYYRQPHSRLKDKLLSW